MLHCSQITFDNPTIADLSATNYNSNQLSYHYQLHEQQTLVDGLEKAQQEQQTVIDRYESSYRERLESHKKQLELVSNTHEVLRQQYISYEQSMAKYKAQVSTQLSRLTSSNQSYHVQQNRLVANIESLQQELVTLQKSCAIPVTVSRRFYDQGDFADYRSCSASRWKRS